jgi:MraZ protein
MYSAKLDERGRLKLPADFQRYLSIFTEKFFVTSLDRQTARIYPMHLWSQNETLFEEYHDDPDAAASVAFIANELGSEAEMDSAGRILFSAELREALRIDQQQVRLYHHRGRIEVLSEEVFQARKKLASENAAASLKKLEGAGLR